MDDVMLEHNNSTQVKVQARPTFGFDYTDEATRAEFLARWDRLIPQAEAEREAAKAAKLTARLGWAKQHGSERLRLALEAGYDCRSLYESEVVEHRFPGAKYDWHGQAETESRSCPGLEGLKRVKAWREAHPDCTFGIVWLTEPPRGRAISEEEYAEMWAEWQPREAVRIDIHGFKAFAYAY